MSTVMDRYSARHVLDRAITSALTERRPAVVIVPEDLQEEEYSGPSRIHGDTYTSVGWSQPAWSPTKRFSGRPRDVLFMIGTSFPSAEWLPREGQARCVEIDIHGSLVGARYPNDVSLVGHANDTLEALIPLLERKKDRSLRSTIEKEIVSWDRVLDDNAHEKGDPVNPQYIFWELNKRLPERAIITSDSGSATNWYARYVTLPRLGARAPRERPRALRIRHRPADPAGSHRTSVHRC